MVNMIDSVEKRSLRRYVVLLGMLWTVAFLILSVWEITEIQRNTREKATTQARAHFFKDNAFRLWATDHGRIYVPVSKQTQPDPYLSHLSERDLTSPSGTLTWDP